VNTDIPPYLAHVAWIARKIEDLMGQAPTGEQLLSRFPRDVAALASHSLEIPILRQPQLTVQGAHEFLCILRGDPPMPDASLLDRPLYGLLHIGPPSNLILIEEELPTPVANYVIAHELSHFFADIFFVQQRWSQALPHNMSEVRRLFSWQQSDGWLELQALIRGLPPRPKRILARGNQERPETAEREQMADLIAREFLAPWSMVAPLFIQFGTGKIVELLCERFGLPTWVARGYRNTLDTTLSPHHDVVDRLFGPLVQRPQSTNS
jgi:hypothetical protein